MLIIPDDPTPNLVLVKNISSKTQKKTIEEFFLFCGKIESIELEPDEDGKHQKAHILFERPSAAKTAVLLSNALVNDSNIVVEPYFAEASQKAGAASTTTGAPDDQTQESKPVSRVMAELMKAGHNVTVPMIAKGIEFDNKYGLSARAETWRGWLNQVLEDVDQRFGVTDKALDVDQRLGIQEKTKQAAGAALQSSPGQKVQDLSTKIQAMYEEAQKLAASRSESSDPKDHLD